MISLKIGLHILTPHGYSGPLGRPAVAKLAGDPSPQDVGSLRYRVGPDGLIVVRFYQAMQSLTETAAYAWVAARATRMGAIVQMAGPNVAFEFYNETGNAQAAQLAAAEYVWAREMHKRGLRCAWGSWASTQPSPEAYRVYRPVLSEMRDGDVISLHTYWAFLEDQQNSWYVPIWARDDRPFAGMPIVVTEAGRDVIADRARHGKHPGYAGWKRAGITFETYLSEIQRFGDMLDGYDDVIGATIYQAGSPDSKWAAYSVANEWPRLVAQYTNCPETEEPPMPEPEPQPEEPRLPIPGARISQRFGENPDYYAQYGYLGHNGVDIAPPAGVPWYAWHGTAVECLTEGEAVQGYSDGYGLYVYVYCAGYDELYAHLSEVLKTGHVQPGDIVGRVGYTGNTIPRGGPGTHLHWSRRPKPYDMANGYGGYADPLAVR